MATEKENNVVRNILFTLGILLLLLFVTNPPFVRDALGTYLIIAGFCFFSFKFGDFQKQLIGIRLDRKSIFVSTGWALLFSGGFWPITKLVPGASIGLPLIPQAVGNTLRPFIIIIVAPFFEEILFRSVIIGYLRNLKIFKNKLQLVLIIQAFLFALAHLTAYVTGFYQAPFEEAILGINAVFASFMAAGIFGYLVGFFVTRDGIRNLLFSILSHGIVNFIIYAGLTVAMI